MWDRFSDAQMRLEGVCAGTQPVALVAA